MTYKSPIAGTSKAGIVIAGSGLAITPEGILSVTTPGLSSSYGEFYSTVTQTNPIINTPNIATFNITKISNGVTMVSGSRMTFTLAGTYLIEVSIQIAKPNGSLSAVVFWLRSNGATYLPYSSRSIAVQGTGASNLSLATGLRILNAGEYLELLWQTDSTAVTLPSTPPNSIPGVPSVQFSAIKIG